MKLPDWLDCLANELLGAARVCLPRVGVTVMCHDAWLLHG